MGGAFLGGGGRIDQPTGPIYQLHSDGGHPRANPSNLLEKLVAMTFQGQDPLLNGRHLLLRRFDHLIAEHSRPFLHLQRFDMCVAADRLRSPASVLPDAVRFVLGLGDYFLGVLFHAPVSFDLHILDLDNHPGGDLPGGRPQILGRGLSLGNSVLHFDGGFSTPLCSIHLGLFPDSGRGLLDGREEIPYLPSQVLVTVQVIAGDHGAGVQFQRGGPACPGIQQTLQIPVHRFSLVTQEGGRKSRDPGFFARFPDRQFSHGGDNNEEGGLWECFDAPETGFSYTPLFISVSLVSTTPLLRIENLHVSANDTAILHGIDLDIHYNEIHAVMGPNGSGKTTLASVLMGHPGLAVTDGAIYFDGEDITGDAPDKRANRGIFMAFQHPTEIPGVPVVQFLRQALSNRTGIDYSIIELRLKVMDAMAQLGIPGRFADRYLNEGFSGGERKRNEILQMTVLEPKLAIMDETDSGLDIDALRTVADGVRRMTSPERGFLIITHFQRLLDYVTPHYVHVLVGGKLVKTGGAELTAQLESEGYESFR